MLSDGEPGISAHFPSDSIHDFQTYPLNEKDFFRETCFKKLQVECWNKTIAKDM